VLVVPVAGGDPAGGSAGVDASNPPPGAVGDVKAKYTGGTIVIRWKNPPDADFESTEITRTPGRNGSAQKIVYRGRGTSFKESALVTGVEYRYVLRALDKAGNRSAGVAVIVVGKNPLLLTPRAGAKIFRPPVFTWRKVENATYYNLQLHRKGKIGTWWPKGNSFKLPMQWTYQGKTHRFTPGVYYWYLWPGFGPLARANYGEMLGQSSFTVAKR
jgi:hypothetical protein